MEPYFETELGKLYNGHVLETLKALPSDTISCCITSPPYWALRDYGTDGVVWGGDADCEHEWGKPIKQDKNWRGGTTNPDVSPKMAIKGKTNFAEVPISYSNFCNKCGAWKGQLGLEPDFNLYIKHLCDIFDEVKRVLRKDGTCWVNLGDTYHNADKWTNKEECPHTISGGNNRNYTTMRRENQGIQNKSLCNIPARFSIEMQNRGWILRNKIIWHKPNCMPSSVTDRFTVDFEEIFFFVKNKKYWFEQQLVPYDAPMNRWGGESLKRDTSKTKEYKDIQKIGHSSAFRVGRPMRPNEQGKNMRTVWKIPTQPFPDAHFAVFPEKLVETPIKAGCPKEICTKCGKPREKIIAKKEYIVDEKEPSNKFKDATVNSAGGRAFITTIQRKYTPNQKDVALYLKSKIKDKALLDEEFGQHTWTHWVRTDESGASLPNPEQYLILKDMLELDGRFDKEMLTTVTIVSDDKGGKTEVIGYTKCDCDAPFVAGIVLDPFMGSGTTAVFCEKNHYQWCGCEVSDKYCEMIKGRLEPYKMQKRLI